MARIRGESRESLSAVRREGDRLGENGQTVIGGLVRFECTWETFRPADCAGVRWLDWDRDYEGVRDFAQDMGHTFTPADWRTAREEGYRYCALIREGRLLSIAAAWHYSETAWEVAAVATRKACRRRGYGKAVVTFVTEYILRSGRTATCTTNRENTAMRRTAEAVGFVLAVH